MYIFDHATCPEGTTHTKKRTHTHTHKNSRCNEAPKHVCKFSSLTLYVLKPQLCLSYRFLRPRLVPLLRLSNPKNNTNGYLLSRLVCVCPLHDNSGSSSRADFAKLVTGTVAATAAAAAPALAKPGTGAKQNWFGVFGVDQELGGGLSNYFAESETYSPYSPYGTPDKALYQSEDQAYMLKVKIDILKDSQKRLQTVPKFIEGKKWEEIRSLLTAKVMEEGMAGGGFRRDVLVV